MSDGKIIQENGENIMPITYETCVLDDEGNPITETIGDVSLLNTESRNLVGAINEVFGDTIKEQVVNVLVDNGVGASINENWSSLIYKIDDGFESKKIEIEEIKNELIKIIKENGYDINENENLQTIISSLNNATAKDIKQVSCGVGHVCVLKKDGSLWVCGINGNGELGLGDTTNRNTFTKVTTNINNDVKQVVCGGNRTFILKNDGSVWATGKNGNGQLGLNDTTNRNTFTQVTTNISDVKEIVCGREHAFILKNDGSIYSCGFNSSGQLGLGDTTDRKTFTQVTTNISDINQISCGDYHTFILKNDGSVWSCGNNGQGQLGLGTNGSGVNKSTFTQVTTNINNDVKQVACGYIRTFILKNDGSLWSCGNNGNGELGLGDANNRTTFTKVTTNINNDVKQVICSVGSTQTWIIKKDGNTYGCGITQFGALAITQGASTFIQNSFGNNSILVSCGGYISGKDYGFAYILKNNGTLWNCGYNYHGQLGTGTNDTNTNSTPKVISPGNVF